VWSPSLLRGSGIDVCVWLAELSSAVGNEIDQSAHLLIHAERFDGHFAALSRLSL
jgi:hypothetical protein